MVTKSLILLFTILSILHGTFSYSCNKLSTEAVSFTSLDATVVTQIAFITVFTLKCETPLPENYALYVEVDGKVLPAARVSENKYQVSWSEEPSKARSGLYEMKVLDESRWATLRRARRSDPAATVEPIFTININHPGSYSGPWVNSEMLATGLSVFIAYAALRYKSKILA